MSTTMTLPIHKPVMAKETSEALLVQSGKRYVDCTLGTGGHAITILEKSSPKGRLLGIDADPEAIRLAKARLEDYSDSIILVNDNFANLEAICKKHDFLPVDGILLDLGMSSLQVDTSDRGFSFQLDAPLDMRFNPAQELTAADIVNALPEDKLSQLIRTYGEEYHSNQISRAIARNRPIKGTVELSKIIEMAVGGRQGKIHPATKTFLALRIAVNRELRNLEVALEQTIRCLKPKGRLVVISYHSLEDRLVKQFMRRESEKCVCPPGIPECRCSHVASLALISRKALMSSSNEIASNPRSRSAKLRVAERL